jgi:hypothetical protein
MLLNRLDRDQDPTPLAHLVAEHDAGSRGVDDDHVKTFLANLAPVPCTSTGSTTTGTGVSTGSAAAGFGAVAVVSTARFTG